MGRSGICLLQALIYAIFVFPQEELRLRLRLLAPWNGF